MTTQNLTLRDTIFRKQVAISLFRWSLRFGLDLSRADKPSRGRLRRAARPPDVPIWLRDDVGLPPQTPTKQWWEY